MGFDQGKGFRKVFNHYRYASLIAIMRSSLTLLIRPHGLFFFLRKFPNSVYSYRRDPRRVVSSYYYKLREEVYDTKSVAL